MKIKRSKGSIDLVKDNAKGFKEIFPDIEKIVLNGKTTIVWLENGNKGKATCSSMDTEDAEVGFAIAYAKAKCGGKKPYVSTVNFFKKRGLWERDAKKPRSIKKKTSQPILATAKQKVVEAIGIMDSAEKKLMTSLDKQKNAITKEVKNKKAKKATELKKKKTVAKKEKKTAVQ